MSVAAVREQLRSFGKADAIMEFEESSATVALAAEKVGTTPERIAKTLAFYDPEADQADDPTGGGSVASRAILIVAAGDVRLHNGSFKRAFGGKARMLAAEDVEPLTGHPIGGVCPFANPPGTRVYLDKSLKRFDLVYPAAGTPSSAVPMTPEELALASGSLGWVEVTKGWQEPSPEGEVKT